MHQEETTNIHTVKVYYPKHTEIYSATHESTAKLMIIAQFMFPDAENILIESVDSGNGFYLHEVIKNEG